MNRNTLLLEGKNDRHVVYSFCGQHHLGKFQDKEVVEAPSKEKLLSNLKTYIRASAGGNIGILIDADENPAGTWESIRNTIREMDLGFSLPNDLPREGLIAPNPDNPLHPLLGVWIMPDNNTSGTLEHFLAYLINDEEQAKLTLASDSITSLESQYPDFINNANHRAKVKLHTYLAWQSDPGVPAGQAITKKYLDPKCPEALTFANWLRSVFF